MKFQNFKIKIIIEIITNLNRLYEQGKDLITTKNLKRKNDSNLDNNSIINLYWWAFEKLCEKGLIKEVKSTKKGNSKQYIIDKLINQKKALKKIFYDNQKTPINYLDWQYSFKKYEMNERNFNISIIKAEREKNFFINKEIKEIYLIEEFNESNKKFQITLAFENKIERNKYIEIMNEGLTRFRFKTSSIKINLIKNN